MPATLKVKDYILVRSTDKYYTEHLNEDNYFTVWFSVGGNTDIVTHNQCCQLPIVEGTGLGSSNLCNISSDPN